MKKYSKYILIFPIVLVLIAISVLFFSINAENQHYITGIVETADVDVASKLPGRIDSIFVHEGSMVKKGDILAIMESKEMDAKVMQLMSTVDAAKSKYDMALNGARPEEKEALNNLYLQAKHQFELAEKTYKRVSNLFKDSLISTQERDQSEFQYKASLEQMYAAKAKLQMALNGARSEEISGAFALYSQAKNGLKEVEAYQGELKIISPITGEISKCIVDQGEIIASGFPIFNIIPVNDNWITIQVREDELNGIQIGKVFSGLIPALNNNKFNFKVTYIAAMGDFANWKPTNQKGEFDLKTFEIHLKPINNIDGLRPGMSVNILY